MSASPDVLCAGIIVADHVSSPISHLPAAGELVLADQLLLTIGGCAANVAVDLVKLGVSAGVAGCVGAFWTKLCRARLFPDAPLDDDWLTTSGVRFGKGLQLVNILRDLPRDLRQGRCYLPGDRLWAIGLTPLDLLEPASGRKLRPLYDAYLEQAEEHLAAGWIYTNALPRTSPRVRLACAWPLLIGIRTVEKLRANNLLAPELHVKVSRWEVRQIIVRTVLWYPWPRAWARLFRRRK